MKHEKQPPNVKLIIAITALSTFILTFILFAVIGFFASNTSYLEQQELTYNDFSCSNICYEINSSFYDYEEEAKLCSCYNDNNELVDYGIIDYSEDD